VCKYKIIDFHWGRLQRGGDSIAGVDMTFTAFTCILNPDLWSSIIKLLYCMHLKSKIVGV